MNIHRPGIWEDHCSEKHLGTERIFWLKLKAPVCLAQLWCLKPRSCVGNKRKWSNQEFSKVSFKPNQLGMRPWEQCLCPFPSVSLSTNCSSTSSRLVSLSLYHSSTVDAVDALFLPPLADPVDTIVVVTTLKNKHHPSPFFGLNLLEQLRNAPTRAAFCLMRATVSVTQGLMEELL